MSESAPNSGSKGRYDDGLGAGPYLGDFEAHEQPSCAGVLVIAAGSVLFTVGTRDSWREKDGTYYIPVGGAGGGREIGETMSACAEREAAEEIGTPVVLHHSCRTYVGVPDGSIHLVRGRTKPSPLLYQIQQRTTATPFGPGHPSGDKLHVSLFRGEPVWSPNPGDVPGLLWAPISSVQAFMLGLEPSKLQALGIRIVCPEGLPDNSILFFPIPSMEEFLVRVLRKYGPGALLAA